jgi:hypothetical protein
LTTAQVIIVCLTVLGLALIWAAKGQGLSSRRTVFEGLFPGQRVVLHLAGDQSIEGSVAEVEGDVLQLRTASLLSGSTKESMGGVVRVPEGSVVALQELETGRASVVAVRRDRD